MQTPDEDPRSAFVRHLPRKIVEIKATLGAVLADPRQLRMRAELRRRIQAVLTVAREHRLGSFADALQATDEALDEAKTSASLTRPQLDRLTSLVASLPNRVEFDTRDPDAPGARAMAVPPSSRSDHPVTRTLIPGAAGFGDEFAPGLQDLARAVSGRRTASILPARTPLAHATQVLFVGSSIRASALLDALGNEADVVLAHTADEALNRARDTAPDVIIAEDDSPYDGVALAASVAADSLVRFIPVVVIACDGEPAATVRERCPEAFDILESDADTAALRSRIHRALRGSPSLPPASAHELGELTLDELIRALQEEIRRGLVGAALPMSRKERVSLGAGDEVLAVTWEAIARIRSVVEKRSGGTVRFELPISPRGLPGAEVFAPGTTADGTGPDDGADDPLPGRRALVVDDDPAVVAQFGDLLRGAGMIVSAHTDGAEALEAARRERPDVVLADILMPGVDGFALCRAIRRDVALRHTPVVLLSWRDDLLIRMRELGAQASGYLRKEADGGAVLARVRSTLRSRMRTLKRIADLPPGAEVRGRLERVGSFALIEATAKALGDATVSLADSGSVTELEIRAGALVSAVRTVQDGSLSRGVQALARALGLNAARFGVRRSSTPVRENLHGPLAEVLDRSARSVTALEEAVSGAALLEVVRVEFDADAALDYARSLPTPLRAAVEQLVQGDAPRDMVLRDGLAPQDLEPLLIELSRRGAIQRVVGRNREDLAATRRERAETEAAKEGATTWETFGIDAEKKPARADLDDVLAKVTRPLGPPRAVPVDSLADAVWRELRDSVEEPVRTTRATTPAPGTEIQPSADEHWDLEPIAPAPAAPVEEVEELSSSSLMVVASDDGPELIAATDDQHARETVRPIAEEDRPAPIEAIAPVEVSPPSDALATVDPSDEEPDPPIALVVHRTSRAPEEKPEEKKVEEAEKVVEAEAKVEAKPTEAPDFEPLELPDIKTSTNATAYVLPAKAKASATTSQSSSVVPDDPSWTRPLLLMAGVAAALALSYGAVRWFLSEDAPTPALEAPAPTARDAGGAATPEPATPQAPAPSAEAEILPTSAVPEGPAPSVTVNGPYREAALYLDGGTLSANSGVLVIPLPRRPGTPVEVSISRRAVGTAPLQRVLREGFYSVQFRAGVVTSNQFVVVRRGMAAVLEPPSER